MSRIRRKFFVEQTFGVARYRSMGTKPQHKQLQPHNRAGESLDSDALKLHQRTVRLPKTRQPLTVLTLRPGTQVAFSTNYFHHTHHIIGDQSGSRLLARLLWGLSYAKTPGLVIALYGEHLRPTPFDADPSLSILLVPAHLTPVCADRFHALKTHLSRLGPPEKTIRCRTYGLDASLKRWDAIGPHQTNVWWAEKNKEHKLLTNAQWKRERMAVCGGFLCYCAPPVVLREQACRLHQMHTLGGVTSDILGSTMDYHYLDEDPVYQGGGGANGEVQIFSDYRARLSVARVARREVRNIEPTLTNPERLRQRIHAHCQTVALRRKPQRQPAK